MKLHDKIFKFEFIPLAIIGGVIAIIISILVSGLSFGAGLFVMGVIYSSLAAIMYTGQGTQMAADQKLLAVGMHYSQEKYKEQFILDRRKKSILSIEQFGIAGLIDIILGALLLSL